MRYLYFSIFLFFVSINLIQAQNQDLCKNGDCPEEVMSIKLDAPLEPGPVGMNTRTEQFKTAYLALKSIRNKQSTVPGWNQKYKDWGLTGTRCVRFFQLEGRFSHEYLQNPSFKTFIDQQESDIRAFKKRGFESSRRAINLLTRMKSKCKKQVEKLEESAGPSTTDLPPVYRKVGEDLGYFDKDGNLKLPDPNEEKAAQMSQELGQIPIGAGSTKQADQKDETAKPDPNQAAIAKMQNHLKSLNLEPEWKKELGICESGLKNLLKKTNPFPKIQLGLKNKVAGFLSGPANILSKLSGLKKVHGKLKTQAQGLTNNKNALKKVDQLISTYTSLKAKAEQAKGDTDKLSKELNEVEKTLNELTQGLNGDLLDVASLQQEVDSLLKEKSSLFTRLSKPIEVVKNIENKVNNFTERYGIFGKKKKCKDRSDEETKAENLSQKQESLQEQIDELEKKIESLKKEQEDLAEDTKQLAEEIETSAQNEIALKNQEQALKEEFGTDVSLDPVPVEEWAESFEVKRPYWEAVFHPDDEVVDGMVGRYFEVKLKDAEKNVKLLFGPGKYFMEKNEFRSNYGSTIGAFVTEAIHYMKKGDENKVRLFVQGSADIAGHKTFRGKLDDRYLYEEVAVLSQNADRESFSSIAVEKTIPKTNFDNTHLPDLRGNYLKEMIGKYSKKLKPTLLEGEVKKFEEVGERNAVIYLFFPEELLSEYEE